MSQKTFKTEPCTDTKLPLDNVVIADFSRVLAGPYCTMLLADMGATVIKVESPNGDDTREWQPPEHNGQSTYFISVNRNKYSVVLDLKDREDLEIAYQIIDRADVFVENFKPNGLKQFGLDPNSVSRRWPHLVHASITGFGAQTDMPGYDLLVQAISGMMTLTGEAHSQPQRSGVAIFDIIAGLHTAVAILSALRIRDRTGTGQHVEMNLLSSALSGLANQTGGYAAAGNVPTRMGNDHPSLFPYGPFNTADREIIICCGNTRQFAQLMATLGLPDVASDSRFTTMANRNANREELRYLIEKSLKSMTADEWFPLLRNAGIPCAPILAVDEGVRFAEELGLSPIAITGNEVQTIRNPIKFSHTPVHYAKSPPKLGGDQQVILQWIKDAPLWQER